MSSIVGVAGATLSLLFKRTDTFPGPLLPVTTSGRPSRLKSAVARERGKLPVANVSWLPNVALPVPARVATLAEFSLAASTSSLPSRFRSSIAICCGLPANGELLAALKVPSPTPVRTESVPELALLTAVRSGMPSRL